MTPVLVEAYGPSVRFITARATGGRCMRLEGDRSSPAPLSFIHIAMVHARCGPALTRCVDNQ